VASTRRNKTDLFNIKHAPKRLRFEIPKANGWIDFGLYLGIYCGTLRAVSPIDVFIKRNWIYGRKKLRSTTYCKQNRDRQISDGRDPEGPDYPYNIIADSRDQAHSQGIYASFLRIYSFEAEEKSIRGNLGIIEKNVRRKYGDLRRHAPNRCHLFVPGQIRENPW
jgi:hypothetical protein